MFVPLPLGPDGGAVVCGGSVGGASVGGASVGGASVGGAPVGGVNVVVVVVVVVVTIGPEPLAGGKVILNFEQSSPVKGARQVSQLVAGSNPTLHKHTPSETAHAPFPKHGSPLAVLLGHS